MEHIQKGGHRVAGFGLGADLPGTRPSPWIKTAADVTDYQNNLQARANRIDAAIANCAAIDATAKAAWTAFRVGSNATLTASTGALMPWDWLQAIEATILQYENMAHELCNYTLLSNPPSKPLFGPGEAFWTQGSTPEKSQAPTQRGRIGSERE